MTYTYRPRGVCSSKIVVELDEHNMITDIKFTGGCSGNTQGVSALAIGRRAEDVIPLLENIRCGFKSTSCPAQLAIALKESLEENNS